MTEHEHSQVNMTLAINKLIPSPTNPRKTFPEEKLQEMANSIAKVGLLQPIIARTARDGKHEIVAGETRWRAARIAGLTDVPVIVRELTDLEAMELQILENLHRNDLSPLEEAHGFKNLLSKSQDGIAGYTIDELADKIGKSRTYVYDSLKLTELPEDASKALASGELNRSTALLIARLDPTVQTSALEKITHAVTDGQAPSYREAQKLVRAEVELSDLNKRVDACLQEIMQFGDEAIDMRNPDSKTEWARWGIGSADWEHKTGYLGAGQSIDAPDKTFRLRVAVIMDEIKDPAGTVYLVGPYNDNPLVVRLYPEGAVLAIFADGIAAGKFSAPAETLEQTRQRLEREKMEIETQQRRQYAIQIIEAIQASPNVCPTNIALKILFELELNQYSHRWPDYSLLQLIDIRNDEELLRAINFPGDTASLTQIALCYFISTSKSVPHKRFSPEYDPDQDDEDWLQVLAIAKLYGIWPYDLEHPKQLATPPAAAQAQEQDARENHDHLAPDDIGQLSEAEAALTPAAPAAQARAVVPPDEDDISRLAPGFARARLRAETKKAKRDQKVSAQADQSQSAPVAAATGETNSSEVAA